MPFVILQQGIESIQAGKLIEGARLLRIALKDEGLAPNMRAAAYLWLVETSTDTHFKRECFSRALAAAPDDEAVRERWRAFQSVELPPTPTPAAPRGQTAPAVIAPTINRQAQPQGNYRIVGIINGPNGPGSAFFVGREGLLATTRHLVGGLLEVAVELEPGQRVMGQVVRAFPKMDVALIQVDFSPDDLMPPSPLPSISEQTPLRAVAYNGQVITGKIRSSKRRLAEQWFTTDIQKLADGGGNPIFDDRHYVVGMLTRNTSRTAQFVHGVHIAAIRQVAESYVREILAESQRAYCPNCGFISRAAAAGFFYCEGCGATMPAHLNLQRYPIPQASVYYDSGNAACPHCGAQSGFHGGLCLRCGRPHGPQAAR